ncbi:MAG: hypothetical protein II417_02800 [Elusimicrobia bacterium]|jgi:hypothetical protein|nr:hypothetical protein [Elusimicrobiota bacterium]MBQ2219707.1 hypothetical protein [Elusimicrobiota bacterium]MBR3654955.1 hypothetical protein [Elusimicrobiota bacterium]
MKTILNIINNKSGQAAVEYVLFTLVMFAASYGMVKLFVIAWKHKFDFISFIAGVSNVLF